MSEVKQPSYEGEMNLLKQIQLHDKLIIDIGVRLTALEGRGQGEKVEQQLRDSKAREDFLMRRIKKENELLMAALEKNAELQRRLEAQTKRQQVEHDFLHAAETWSLDPENVWDDLIHRFETLATYPGLSEREKALLNSLADTLAAAKDEAAPEPRRPQPAPEAKTEMPGLDHEPETLEEVNAYLRGYNLDPDGIAARGVVFATTCARMIKAEQKVAELTRRLAASAPTPWQQVAEAFLHAALKCTSMTGKRPQRNLRDIACHLMLENKTYCKSTADWLMELVLVLEDHPDAAVLESAARDKAAPEPERQVAEKDRWLSGGEAQIINPLDDEDDAQ